MSAKTTFGSKVVVGSENLLFDTSNVANEWSAPGTVNNAQAQVVGREWIDTKISSVKQNLTLPTMFLTEDDSDVYTGIKNRQNANDNYAYLIDPDFFIGGRCIYPGLTVTNPSEDFVVGNTEFMPTRDKWQRGETVHSISLSASQGTQNVTLRRSLREVAVLVIETVPSNTTVRLQVGSANKDEAFSAPGIRVIDISSDTGSLRVTTSTALTGNNTVTGFLLVGEVYDVE